MARRHLQGILSKLEQSVDEVWLWFEFQATLIEEERGRVLDALLTGAPPPSRPRYFGKTRDELIELFDGQRDELDAVTMLGLLTSAEASLRVDFIQRVMMKKKDAVSRDFTKTYKKTKLKIQLDSDILKAHKRHARTVSAKSAIGEFRAALRLRDWLAHGRYWKPNLGHEYDPRRVFDTCRQMLNAIT